MDCKYFISTLIAAGLADSAGAICDAVAASKPVLTDGTHTSRPSGPLTITPSMPIFFLNGDAHASVKVDRTGLAVRNFTTATSHHLFALGVLGDSSSQISLLNFSGRPRGGLEGWEAVLASILDRSKPINVLIHFFCEDYKMRYGIAWLLGVPVSVLVIVYLFTHLL
jgi:hypothetical protein